MQIPYDPGVAIEAVRTQLQDLRALWRGERLPRTGVPDLEPMFPPVHRVPLWVAGYRKAFHELAGEAADGYLARPAESIPAIRIAQGPDRGGGAGRPGATPDEIEIGGYLLSLVDSSRRAALDRAKREPFVIYMLAVQSDTAMRRVGLDPELKGRVFAAWREGDYHRAAGLIPDELVDAFILCGTPDEVAARAAEYADAGMTVPVLQPVLQEEDQVGYVLDAAVTYGSGRRDRGGRAAGDRGPVPGGGLGRPPAAQPGRDHPAVRADRLDRAGLRGRRAGAARRADELGPVRAGAGRRGAAAGGHQRDQRGVRRPQGHRLDHLAAGVPGAGDRAGDREGRVPAGVRRRSRSARSSAWCWSPSGAGRCC